MASYVALLRAINVGGRNLIAMSELRELFAKLGLASARTLLQSGNVVFESEPKPAPELQSLLEAATRKRFGHDVDYVIRSAREWESGIADNPFPAEAKRDPGRLIVVFMKQAPKVGDVKALVAAIRGPEVVKARGAQLYAVYPDGQGRSKLTIPLIEKTLGTRGTGRNWNTVLKLAATLREPGGAPQRPAAPKPRPAPKARAKG